MQSTATQERNGTMKYELKNSGLFIHWGINTGNPNDDEPVYGSFEEFEDDAVKNGWNAKKWVQAAKKLRASYITFAAFHNCLGFLKLWKSKIPGTYTSKHDFLGELIEEAKKENIRVLVYITPEPRKRCFADGTEFIDTDAYKKYKNDQAADLLDWDYWQTVYCKEVIEEIIENYPDVGGFWFDGWSCKKNAEMIFAMIEEKDSRLLKIRNNFGRWQFKNEDMISVEQFGKVYNPGFDLASSCWQEAGKNEFCYTMEQTGDWWYYPTRDYKFNGAELLRQFVSVCAYGLRPHVGLGAYVSGDFRENIEKYLNMMDNFLSWGAESVFDIEPGILPQCYVNDGGYILTTKRDRVHYIHILKAPKCGRLEVQDGGYEFSCAENLKTGEKVDFVQNGGKVYLSCDFSECEWEGDMVIKLCEQKRNIAGERRTEGEKLPCGVMLELGGLKKIRGIFLEQKNNSAQHNGSWGGVDNNRLKNCRIWGTDKDGAEFLIKEMCLGAARGNKQIDCECEIKSIRLEAIDAYDTDGGRVCYMSNEGERAAFKKLPYKNVVCFAKKDDVDYVLTDDGKLCGYSGGKKEEVAEGVIYLFSGENGEVYYIDSHNQILTVTGGETGYFGDIAAVDNNGGIYTVREGVLCFEGERIDSGVTGLCTHDGVLEYCCGGDIVTIRNNEKTIYKTGYSFVGITSKTVLLEDGNLLFRSGSGREDCVYATDVARATEINNVIYVVKRPKCGKLMITDIMAIGENQKEG